MTDPKSLVTHQYQFTVAVDQGMSFGVSGNFTETEDLPAMNAKMDVVLAIVNRIRAIYEIPKIMADMAGMRRREEEIKLMALQNEQSIEQKVNGGARATGQMLADKGNHLNTLRATQAELQRLGEMLVARQAEADYGTHRPDYRQ